MTKIIMKGSCSLLLGIVGVLSLCGKDLDMSRGCLFLAGALILAMTVVFDIVIRKNGGRTINRVCSATEERIKRGVDVAKGRECVNLMLRNLDKLEQDAAQNPHGYNQKGTPENPRPQVYDFDNGKCPYKRDSSKPLGSKENPIVAGIPEHSTHLVFSTDRGCWILTDGLGNGWIR